MTSTARSRKHAARSISAAGVLGTRRQARTAPGASPSFSAVVARTVTDAQEIGKDLVAAGLTLAKGTVTLAYDLGTAVGVAGKSLIAGTVEAAGDIVGRTEMRKPLARASRSTSGRRRKAASA